MKDKNYSNFDNFEDLQEEIESKKKQIKTIKENLRYIEERISEYVQEEKIDLQLIKNRDHRQNELKKIYADLEYLKKHRLSKKLKDFACKKRRLLPYLVNRKPQENILRRKLKIFINQNYNKPLVCIVHGDESQCHYDFLEIIREVFLPTKFLPTDFENRGKKRTVVLIDEVDKAPRDFPNDILNELDLLYFRIPELGNVKIEADRNSEYQPIVIITSNSEKDLPEAFLRRCVYYDIPFPDDNRLREIINNRLGLFSSGTNQFLDDALDLFEKLRVNLNKKPATAELLGWLLTLQKVSGNAKNPLAETDLAKRTLSSLVKTAADQQNATQLVNQWMEERKSRNKPG